jgi:hypothetical protein
MMAMGCFAVEVRTMYDIRRLILLRDLAEYTTMAAVPMSDPWQTRTDVLVIGGGPAACWAALSARETGADVVLVDKGYCGTSGATAPAGTGVWYVAPDPAARAAAKASREELGGYLADHQSQGNPTVRPVSCVRRTVRPTHCMWIHSPHRCRLDGSLPAEEIGRYRREVGWGRGRRPGSRIAVGPELPSIPPPRLS